MLILILTLTLMNKVTKEGINRTLYFIYTKEILQHTNAYLSD
jgi:hypothetical protein